MAKTKWTEKDDQYLTAFYHLKPATTLAKHLKISKQSVLRRAKKLNLGSKHTLRTAQRRRYSSDEDRYIFEYLKKHGAAHIALALQRTEQGIRNRAKRLGIQLGHPTSGLTPKQEQVILESLPHKTYHEIGELLGKSGEAIRWHCRQRKWTKKAVMLGQLTSPIVENNRPEKSETPNVYK